MKLAIGLLKVRKKIKEKRYYRCIRRIVNRVAVKKQILEKVRMLPNVTLPSAENGQRMQRKEK